jgi:hypothetical protein
LNCVWSFSDAADKVKMEAADLKNAHQWLLQTRTPLTMRQVVTGAGLRVTTAPFGPAQPACFTPRAQTTACAGDATAKISATTTRLAMKRDVLRILAPVDAL